MELKYKEQKIRDLFVYHTNIYPVGIDIGRHSITIFISQNDADEYTTKIQSMEKYFTDALDRKVEIATKN